MSVGITERSREADKTPHDLRNEFARRGFVMKTQTLGKYVAAGLTLCTVASCGFDRREFAGLSAEPAEQGQPISGIRFLDACPTTLNGAAFTIKKAAPSRKIPEATPSSERSKVETAVIATVADAAVELVGLGLKQSRDRLNGTFIATGAHIHGPEIVSRKPTKPTDCIVIYNGLSGKTPVESVGDGLHPSILTALELTDQPAFYLELASTIEGTTHRALRVNALQYAATSALRTGSGKKTVTVALGLGGSGENVESPTAAVEVFMFNLGQLDVGKIYPGNENQIVVAPRKAEGSFNMVAKITESEDPTIALTAMITAFDANKSALSDALGDAIKGGD